MSKKKQEYLELSLPSIPKIPKPIKFAILSGTLVAAIVFAVVGTNRFYNNYYFEYQTPVIIQKPILVKSRVVKEEGATEVVVDKKDEVEKEKVSSMVPVVHASEESPEIREIVRIIAILESNTGQAPSGKHQKCYAKGMTNNYGYRALQDFCFNNEAEAVATVTDWMERSLEVRSLPASLCRYNTGRPTEDCQYYQDYLKLGGI